MSPFVSIVMPVRNEAAFIEQNLRQILSQDYPAERMEILVADGSSDDGTREILDRLAAETNRITVIDNPARIVPTGLNAAIRESRGEIIIRVDGHVIVAEDFVRQSVDVLLAHPDAWAAGGPIVHRAHTPSGKANAAAMSHRIGVGNASHRMEDFEGYGEGTAFPAMHRWVFDRIGFYDEALVRNQDDELYYRLNQAGGKFFISPKIKYTYFVREKRSQLFRQYYQYSFWRIPVIRKHKQPTTIRQMIPSLFYLSVLGLLLLGIVLRNGWVAAALPAIYAGALLAAGLLQIPSLGVSVALRMPLSIATMHAGYALGMVQGAWYALLGKDAWARSNQKVVQLSR